MKHLFIINPAAGSRNRMEQYQAQIHDACHARDLDYTISITNAPGDATRLVQEAAKSGEEIRVYACGGDGTLNEVAAGAAGCDHVSITVFAGGSGNDFIKNFDDPKAFYDIHRLLDAQEDTFDMIRCNDDLALNICCVGLDAQIGKDVARYKRLPMLGGFRAYAFATLIHLCGHLSEHYVVEINGERLDQQMTFVCVCNGRYYGGGFNPIPEADLADGLLDVLVVDKLHHLQVPSIIGKYKNGRYKELGHVARHFRTDKLTVTCDQPSPINLDGEIRMAQKVEFSIAEEKVHFFYPKGLRWKA